MIKRIAMMASLLVTLSSSIAFAEIDRQATRALLILVDELKSAGYEQITISPRIFGGYVVEATNDQNALLVSLDASSLLPNQSEFFGASDDNGFFGTSIRPLDQASQDVIKRYVFRLASSDNNYPTIALGAFMRDSQSQNLTAGFSQERDVDFENDTFIVRQTETLGMLGPVSTNNTVSMSETVDGGNISSQAVSAEYSYSTQENLSVIRMESGNGFDSNIFIAPDTIRENIQTSVVQPSINTLPSQDIIKNQIASQFDGLVARSVGPNSPVNLPQNTLENINAVLAAPLE